MGSYDAVVASVDACTTAGGLFNVIISVSRALFLLMVILAAAGSTAGQVPPQPVLSGEGLPDGPGKDVTVKAAAVS